MKRKRFSVEQIVAVLKQAEAGMPVAELIRHVGISEQTFYRWKKVYAGLQTDQVRQLKQLQDENAQLKKVVAELTLEVADSPRSEHKSRKPSYRGLSISLQFQNFIALLSLDFPIFIALSRLYCHATPSRNQAKFFAAKSQFTMFQNASTNFGRALR